MYSRTFSLSISGHSTRTPYLLDFDEDCKNSTQYLHKAHSAFLDKHVSQNRYLASGGENFLEDLPSTFLGNI